MRIPISFTRTRACTLKEMIMIAYQKSSRSKQIFKVKNEVVIPSRIDCLTKLPGEKMYNFTLTGISETKVNLTGGNNASSVITSDVYEGTLNEMETDVTWRIL